MAETQRITPAQRVKNERLETALDLVERQSKELKTPLRVLELGSGDGSLTLALAALGHRSLGLDSSHPSVFAARLKAQETLSNALFADIDYSKPDDWRAAARDSLGGVPQAVLLTDVLHAVADSALLGPLQSWLEPGAVLVVAEENPQALSRRLGRMPSGPGLRDFKQWAQRLRAHGFEPCKKPVGFDRMRLVAELWTGACESLIFTARRS